MTFPSIFQIKKISGEECLLQFMAQDGNLFLWPSKEDLSWEPKSSIQRLLPFPALSKKSSSRKQLFEF